MTYTVVFAANNSYIQHFSVALASLLHNNKRVPFAIYLLNEGLTPQNQQIIDHIIADFPVTFKNLIVDEQQFNNLHTGANHLSVQTFFRLFIPQLFPNEERVLYLDADLVVAGNIEPLFHIPFDDNYVLAVKDTFTAYAQEMKLKLQMSPEATFFNAGVLMLNIPKWIADDLVGKIIDFAATHPQLIAYADQDSINAVIDIKAKILPLRYNIQFSLLDRLSQFTAAERQEAQQPCIVHYTGGYPYKPWFYACINPLKNLYYQYLQYTPFKNFKPAADYMGVLKYRWLRPIYQKIKPFIRK